MKKFSTIIMAIALVLGLAQCKKQEIPATPDDDGKWVHITLNMGDSGKHIVYPNTGAVVYTENDTIYVGNDGKFIGKLVYHSGAFSGDIYFEISFLIISTYVIIYIDVDIIERKFLIVSIEKYAAFLSSHVECTYPLDGRVVVEVHRRPASSCGFQFGSARNVNDKAVLITVDAVDI